MKKRLARMLRRTADRIDPAGQNLIVSLDATWSRTEPPHIDLELIGGHRMSGYVRAQL